MSAPLAEFRRRIEAAGHDARRANGGWLLHALPLGSDRSLCGHQPRNTGRNFHRGCWRIGGAHEPCRRCEAKLPELTP